MKSNFYTPSKEQAIKSAVRIYKGTALHSRIVHGLSFVAYYSENRQRYGLLVFFGKSGKPREHYDFASQEKRESYALHLVSKYKERQELKQKENATRAEKLKNFKASDVFMVGDVVYSSWGYDQTNIDWYQITEIKPKSVVIRRIMENSSDRGQPGGGYTFPRRNEFCGDPMTKKVTPEGYVCNGRFTLYKWDGRKKYTSSDR